MGIRFACHHCHHPMHVKDYLAGKRGRCPECNQSFRVPISDADFSLPPRQESNPDRSDIPEQSPALPDSSTSTATARTVATSRDATSPNLSNLPSNFSNDKERTTKRTRDTNTPLAPSLSPAPTQAQWFVRPASGGEYGPASDDLIRGWIAERRVTADSYVWTEGQANWLLAGQVFEDLYAPSAPLTTSAANISAFSDSSNSGSLKSPSQAIPSLTPTSEKTPRTRARADDASALLKPGPDSDERFNISLKSAHASPEHELDMGLLDFAPPSALTSTAQNNVNAGAAAEMKAKRRQQQKATQLKIIAALSVISVILLAALIVVLWRSANKSIDNKEVPNTPSSLSPAPPSIPTDNPTSTQPAETPEPAIPAETQPTTIEPSDSLDLSTPPSTATENQTPLNLEIGMDNPLP